MISHKHKCIFIHIGRTGGTTIERWLQGEDQWNILHNFKHLTTGYAKDRAYPEYWNDYFKFTFVRNPYEQVLSSMIVAGMSRYRHMGLNVDTPEESLLRFSSMDYYDLYCQGGPFINDYYEDLIPNCVYKNILRHGVDKVYRYEEYKDSVADIASTLGITKPENLQKHGETPEGLRLTQDKMKPKDYQMINEIYGSDFEEYGYERL